jgi:hypothetical protein
MNFNFYKRTGLLAAFCLLTGAAMSAPAELAKDTAKVILTVKSSGVGNQVLEKQFNLAMLEALPQQTFTTMTPWDKSPIKFTGPLLRDVLGAAKASGKTIKAAALNDYATVIPVDDAYKFDVIVAHRMNGELIPVRTKGPLFIVYPYDTKPELRASTYYERSAWQLKSLSID